MYDPKFSQKQMYDQYGRSRPSNKKVDPKPSKSSGFGGMGPDPAERFGGSPTRGIGAKTPSTNTFGGGQDNNPNRDESENKSTIAKVYEEVVDFFESFGADKPKDVIVDGKKVYQGPAFRGYDPTTRIGQFGGEYGKQQYLFGAESLGIFGPGIKTTRSPVPPTLPPSTINMFGVNTDNPRLNMFGVNRSSTRPPEAPKLPTSPDVPEVMISTEEDYTIQLGDTLSGIAKDRNTTVDVLLELNNIKEEDKNKIFAGDNLKVPPKKLTATQAALRESLGSKVDYGDGVEVAGAYPLVNAIPPLKPDVSADTYESPDEMSDLEILARTIQKEAGGESDKGKLAVGAVIANRVKAKSWMGKNLKEVILKPGQFSPWNSYTNYAGGEQGKEMLGVTAKPSEASYEAARKILSGDYEDPTKGATHFVNPKISKPSWYGKFEDNDPLKIGKHQFGSPDNPNWKFIKSLRPKVRPKGLGTK